MVIKIIVQEHYYNGYFTVDWEFKTNVLGGFDDVERNIEHDL